MRVLLARPVNLEKVNFQLSPDLGLGYLATALLRKGHEVKILDAPKERISLSDFVSSVREFRPDVAGFKAFTFDVASTKKGLELVKEIDASITTVVGGAHPSCDCERIFEQFPSVDWGFRGEAEIGFSMLLDHLAGDSNIQQADIPGLIWKDNGAVRCNKPHFSEDIDSFGMPSWHLMDPRNYPPAPFSSFGRKFPVVPIIATRGCPFPCTFCAASAVTGRRLRKRSVELIIREIELLYNDFGVREIQFVDDNITYDKDFAVSLFSRIVERGFPIDLSIPNGVRLDSLDEELVSLMHKAGIYSVAVGIESASKETLKRMKKMLDIDIVDEKIKLLKKAGIKVTGLFILGFPGDTKADIEKTIRFSRKVQLDKASFFNFMPTPGTAIYKQLEETGELPDQLTGLHSYKVSMPPKDMTVGQLKRMQLLAFLRFYLRPRIIRSVVEDVTSLEQMKILADRVFKLLSMR